MTEKQQGGPLGVNKNVLFLDYVSGYMDANIYQNSLNCTLEMGAFYFVLIIPQ